MRILLLLLLYSLAAMAVAQPRYYRYPPNRSGQQMPRDHFSIRTPAPTAPPSRVQSNSSSPGVSTSSRGTPSIVTKPTLIASAGAYALGDNVSALADATTAVIVIAADNVTLDLRGFHVRGRSSANPDASGIMVYGNNVSVSNGSVTDFNQQNQCGVIVAEGVQNFTLDSLRIQKCETGILLNPNNVTDAPTRSGLIDRCQVSDSAVGILAFTSSGIVITRCTSTNAAARHDYPGEGSGAVLRGESYIIEDCAFHYNAHGLRLEADHSIVRTSTFNHNRNTGAFISGNGCRIQESLFCSNGLIGLNVAAEGATIDGCTCSENEGHGLALDAGEDLMSRSNVIRNCSFISNRSDGLTDKGEGSNLIVDCFASMNKGTGLNLHATDIYRDCVTPGNAVPVAGGTAAK